MISAFSFRIPKPLLILIIPLNLVLIFGIIVYVAEIPTSDYVDRDMISLGFRQLSEKFDFGYLNQNVSDSDLQNVDTYSNYGYKIRPNNVKFKFVNPKKKKGNPETILKKNKETFDKVMAQEIHEPKDADIETMRPPSKKEIDTYQHANATIIALVRNNEALAISKTIRRLETSFNSKFRYPYTFINDEPFTERFMQRMQKLSDAPMEFVTIPSELWKKPSHIDEEREEKAMQLLSDQRVSYAKKGSYHNMCRFYLGNFYNVPELKKYQYYWRIEPNVQFYNDLKYDVFKYMEATKKVYGFAINLYDISETVVSLWPETLKFLNKGDNYKYVNPNGAFQWLLENQQNPKNNKKANGYSTCHFWSNFEIGDMDFFRGEAYNNWFKYLDSTGNFYYERWGDAPVHSMGLALFADTRDIHWFRDIGYFHDPYVNCPNSPNTIGCESGQFSRWGHLSDQNCMASWIDYSMEDPSAIY